MKINWYLRLLKGLGLGLIFFLISFHIVNKASFAGQSMKQEDMQVLIEKARDAWVARDAKALAQLFTDDGEIVVPGQRWQGQSQIRKEINRFAQQYSDVKIVIQRIIFADTQAVVEWYYEDTEKATGHRNKADDAIVIDFKDGRISRWREYFDTKTPANRS